MRIAIQLSVCSDVSADRSGSVRDLQLRRSSVCTLVHRQPPRSVSATVGASAGERPAVGDEVPRLKPPAFHGVTLGWQRREVCERRQVGQRREGFAVTEVERLQRGERRQVGQRREGFATRSSVCSDVSADRSGSAVRELQPSRLSVCSDVSADRSGSAVREQQRSSVCTLVHRDSHSGSVAPPYPDRSISVESSGQPSVMKSHALKPPASHGVR